MLKANIIAISVGGIKKIPVKDITITFKESRDYLFFCMKKGRVSATVTIDYINEESQPVSKIADAIIRPKSTGETALSLIVNDETSGGILHTDILYE